jgi:hypothetical protein
LVRRLSAASFQAFGRYPTPQNLPVIIHLGRGSPHSSSSLPGNYGGPPLARPLSLRPFLKLGAVALALREGLDLRATAFPYLALLHVGFAKPIRYRIAGALLPHLFTLTVDSGGMFSVALSVPYGPSRYEAHCPVEFGLSSALPFRDAAITRLPANL